MNAKNQRGQDDLMGTAQLNLPSAELSARRFGEIR